MPQEFSRLARWCATFAMLVTLAACGGGGGSLGSNPPGGGGEQPPGSGGATITITGRVTFDRLQFQQTVGSGLNAAAPVVSPAREVVVQALSGNTTLATTSTDANGNYSLNVPVNTNMTIRASARMEKTGAAPTWRFVVRNNTNSDAEYVMQLDSFNSGAINQVRDLHAASGWSGTGYTGTRVAAPFAILDTVYQTKQLILGAAPTTAFPELNLFWSEDNREGGSDLCPDDGNIGTSFYFDDPSGTAKDDCNLPLPEGIYILGDFAGGNGDTDEFDQHVIAHEFGHYVEAQFSRSDSIGGEHGGGDTLDMRTAFGEGWGNAFGAMALNDPEYRDSARGISDDGGFNLENGQNVAPGWFSELSVGQFLWDVFDTTPESGDNVTLGFTPIFAVMTGPQKQTDAFTSIFSFASALRDQNGSQRSAINSLLNNQDIHGNDEFGTGETNDGGVPVALPVYTPVALGGAQQAYVCSSAAAGAADLNKLGNRHFLVFENEASRTVQIRANGATTDPSQDAAGDPDILVYRRGVVIATGTSGDPDATLRRTETVNVTLGPGTYVLDVYDAEVTGSRPRCMTVSITG